MRDPEVHKEVIEKIVEVMSNNGLSVLGLDFSPVKGPEGNIEYLIYVQKNNDVTICEDIDINKITGASTATICRVSKCLNYGDGGYKTAIERIKEN